MLHKDKDVLSNSCPRRISLAQDLITVTHAFDIGKELSVLSIV